MEQIVDVTHVGWLFRKWPLWVKTLTSFGSVLAVCITVITLCLAFVKTIDAKAIARAAAENATSQYKVIADQNQQHIKENDAKIRKVEDDNLRVAENIKFLKESAARIESKLDAWAPSAAKADAMWQQRIEGKTNRDVIQSGVIDSPLGPPIPSSAVIAKPLPPTP